MTPPPYESMISVMGNSELKSFWSLEHFVQGESFLDIMLCSVGLRAIKTLGFRDLGQGKLGV